MNHIHYTNQQQSVLALLMGAVLASASAGRKESLMTNAARRFGILVGLVAPLLLSGVVHAKENLRIDGSSDDSVRQSYQRVYDSLKQECQMKLSSAIVQLNNVGINSADEMLADPELRNPGPVRIKDNTALLDSNEIMSLANRTATVKTYIKGREAGVPADLLTPLAAGQPSYSLASTQWRYVTNINGFRKGATLDFEPDGKLESRPPSTAEVSAWEQSADEVRLFCNDRYAVSRGKLVDDDHMQGTAGNHVGSTWTAERH